MWQWEVRSFGFAGALRVYYSGSAKYYWTARIKSKLWAIYADWFRVPSELGVQWVIKKPLKIPS